MKFTVSRLAELGLSEGAKRQLRYRFGELEGVQPCVKEPMKVMERRIKRWRRVGSRSVAERVGVQSQPLKGNPEQRQNSPSL